MKRSITKFLSLCLFLLVWAVPVQAEAGDWVVSAEQAKSMIEEGDVTVLDTRKRSAWKKAHVFGSTVIDWRDFSRDDRSERGMLLEDVDALTKRLQEHGVSEDRAVLVVGNPPDNWGEDGRIVWMLRSLGHTDAALVDGGFGALVDAGVDTTDAASDPDAGDFVAQPTDRWMIDRSELRERRYEDGVVLLDTREQREYRGKTPYGETRGGHLPGAHHLHYADLMDASGKLLEDSEITAKLRSLGIDRDDDIIAYCTGGVRSAWLVVILADLGFEDVRNYPGSMWEWSAASAATHPLEKD